MNKVGSFPSWLSDLAGMLQKKSEQTVTAETNVQNLPTVTWENETFYVKFDDNGATLYNKFANIAKEIENAKTIEDVDKFLNENLVTASKEDEEIEGNDELSKELEQIMSEEDSETDEETPVEETQDTNEESFSREEFDSLKNEVKEIREMLEKLLGKEEPENKLEARLASLETKCAELYRAYTVTENDQYDLNSQEEEMNHVKENIDISQKIIDKEHELDLSKQEDRGKLNADFLKEILDDVKDNIQDFVEDGIEEAKEVVKDVVENDTPVEDTVETPESDVLEESIILLEDPQMIEEFSNQVCPFCHNQQLAASGTVDNIIGVKCGSCDKEFAVNIDDNSIRYKK